MNDKITRHESARAAIEVLERFLTPKMKQEPRDLVTKAKNELLTYIDETETPSAPVLPVVETPTEKATRYRTPEPGDWCRSGCPTRYKRSPKTSLTHRIVFCPTCKLTHEAIRHDTPQGRAFYIRSKRDAKRLTNLCPASDTL